MPDLTRPTDDEVREAQHRWRKKPVEIEAFKLGDDWPDWFADAVTTNEVTTHANDFHSRQLDYALIKTLEGTMRAERGDWIIRGTKGELYPCKPDIFAEIYEPATPQPPIAAEAGERKLRPCSTVCKGSLIVADTASTDAPSSFRIECEDCGAIGSEAPTEAEAVNAWNQRGDSYMALAEEIIRGLTECGNRMSVGDQVRLAHRLATLTPPERTAGEGEE
jgi:hypothetical protein